MDSEDRLETETAFQSGPSTLGVGEDSAATSLNTPVADTRRVMIVKSPKAGTGLHREQLPRLIDRLRRSEIDVTATDRISDLREFSRGARQQPVGSHLVVAAGGDGTLTLVAENVFPNMPLVPMPLGTENLLARQFGYKSDADKVHQTIQHGESYWLDAGRANGQPFLVMATCGFDAEVVRAVHLRRRGHISRWSYVGPIFRAVRRYRFPRIHVQTGDTGTTEAGIDAGDACGWAMVFNLPRYGGNLRIEPDAVGNDGRLDVILFKQGSLFSGLRYLAGIKMGTHRGFQDVVRRPATTIRITSDQRVPYQLDGDYAGHLPLTIQTVPGRIHLRVPAKTQ